MGLASEILLPIEDGPNRYELMMALFEDKQVTFRTADKAWKVKVHSLYRDRMLGQTHGELYQYPDETTESWLIFCSIEEPTPSEEDDYVGAIFIAYNSKVHKGRLTYHYDFDLSNSKRYYALEERWYELMDPSLM